MAGKTYTTDYTDPCVTRMVQKETIHKQQESTRLPPNSPDVAPSPVPPPSQPVLAAAGFPSNPATGGPAQTHSENEKLNTDHH